MRRRFVVVVCVVVLAFIAIRFVRPGVRRPARAPHDEPPAAAVPAADTPRDATHPQPARARLSVVVRDSAGALVPDVRVVVTRAEAVAGVAATDRAGLADFGARHEPLLDVWVEPEPGVRLAAGTFRRREGDTRLAYVLHAPRALVVRVDVDGVRRLPDECRVVAPVLLDAARDPAAGEWRGRFYPDGGFVHVRVDAPGTLGAGGEARGAVPADGPVEVTVSLRARATLHVTVIGEDDMADARHVWRLERFDADDGWRELTGNAELDWDGLDGRESAAWSVAPGRFRTVLDRSGAVLDSFDVGGGDLDHVVDLKRIEWARMLVRLPVGVDPAGTLLRCIEEGREDAHEIWWRRDPHPQQPFFRVPLPAGRTFRFVAVHPLCVPDPAQGPVEVRGGGDHPIRMVRGALLRFRIANAPQTGSLFVQLYAPGTWETPVLEAGAAPTPGGYGLAGWPPGKYTVVVHPHRGEPIVVRDVTLPPEGTDVGELEFRRGSTLRVVFPQPGPDPERIDLVSEAQPRISRRRWRGATPLREVTFHGLPAGRYTLAVRAGALSSTRTIDLDGETDHDLALR